MLGSRSKLKSKGCAPVSEVWISFRSMSSLLFELIYPSVARAGCTLVHLPPSYRTVCPPKSDDSRFGAALVLSASQLMTMTLFRAIAGHNPTNRAAATLILP